MRETGILLSLSSLPGGYGAGDMGAEAMAFVDLLSEAGVKVWQLLPLGPTGYGNSPYQPDSSQAGDPMYISLAGLHAEGLLSELPPPLAAGSRVDYEAVRAFRAPWLRRAFEGFQPGADYEAFARQSWVQDYAVFRSFKVLHNGACWIDWPEAYRDWPKTRDPSLTAPLEAEIRFQCFLQYQFARQWRRLRDYAHEKGVKLLGDMPFYVGLDSVEVWAGRDNFLLEQDGRPSFVAGVPPDYFSETGQRWGNPIYNWEKLKKDGYQFWIDRIGYSQKLFDVLRIDHFRAFDTFWKIPSSCPTAVEGAWIEAPGYAVLDTLYETLPGLQLVAEDLGDLRPEVLTLRDHYHLPGMKVLEFTVELTGKRARDTSPDVTRQIVYTGTHDNATVVEWYESLTIPQRRKLRRYLKERGAVGGQVYQRMVRLALKSKAELAVIPVQDVLGLGKEARMNLPGTVGAPNWQWRLKDFEALKKAMKPLARAIRETKRA